VVVTHDSAAEIPRSLPAIAAELRSGDELIVCDNASTDGTPALVGELVPGASLQELGSNAGFGAACNAGAGAAANDLLLFLNPDAVVEPGFRDAIELPLIEGRGWDAWQALVTAEGGKVVNSWGGVVHFSGIAWAGGAGRPLAEAPAGPAEVTFASGACLVVRREAWEALAGFSADYFLYHEDTDLGLRLWLTGHRVGIEPRARCEHGYEFEKGPHKWYYLERNRYATVIRTYPTRLLLALLPGLIATEPALLLVAASGGWLVPKLRAYRDTALALPRLARERATIRDHAYGGPRAPIDAAEFAGLLTPDLDSEYLGPAAGSAPLRVMLRGYWRLVRMLTG
jgi:GT2 family glycosyltransferase